LVLNVRVLEHHKLKAKQNSTIVTVCLCDRVCKKTATKAREGGRLFSTSAKIPQYLLDGENGGGGGGPPRGKKPVGGFS